RFNISPTVMLDGTTPCNIEFINSPYDDFILETGDNNINLIRLRLIVPVDAYHNNEIPEAHYELNTTGTSGVPMTTSSHGQIVVNGKMINGHTNTPIFESSNLITDFDNVTVDITRSTDIYTIEYLVIKGNKIIKGRYVGQMPFVSN